MEKLSNDEMLLIMLEMKKRYEEEYKILETKFRALTKYCNNIMDDEGDILYRHILMKADKCSFCEGYAYEVKVKERDCNCDDTDDCICEITSDTYFSCYVCGVVFCKECLDNEDECVIEYLPNPIPNKFWCKECYNKQNNE